MLYISTIIEIFNIAVSVYRYLDNQITEAQFNASVKARKDARQKFEAAREVKDKARWLREYQDEFNKEK